MKHPKAEAAFTLVELLVVIGIIAVLIAILLPSLQKARQASLQVACVSNLRQIATAEIAYTIEYRGYLPHGAANAGVSSWTAKLAPWTLGFRADQYTSLKVYKVYSCPIQPDIANGFKVNPYLGVVGVGDTPDPLQPYRISNFKYPGKKCFVVEGDPLRQNIIRDIYFHALQSPTLPTGLIDLRHSNRRANIAFLDGHVDTLTAPPLPQIQNVAVGDTWLTKDTPPPSTY